MTFKVFSIVFVSLLIAGFSAIDFAYAQTLTTTPYDGDNVMLNHSIIIDIKDAATQNPIPITIQVTNSTGDDHDFETFDVEYDSSFWQRHRIIVTPLNEPWDPSKTGDGLIQVFDSDTITIQITGTQEQSILTFQDHHAADISTGLAGNFGEIVPCDNDIDLDAICDEWETGTTLTISDNRPGGLPGTYSIDCRDTHPSGQCGNDKRDIFVEVDWIDSHTPDPKALEAVQNSFLNHDIRLHLQVNTEPAFGHAPRIAFPGYDDGPKGFDQLKSIEFGTATEQASSDWGNEKNLKHQVFHYTIFGHHDEFSSTSTGESEVLGNDFVVHLSKFTGKIGSTDQQAGTFMHELGHNLGLHHGGSLFDTINNKPNLFSVMSYVRQFSDFDQNRNLDYSEQKLGHHHSTDKAQNAWRSANEWAIDETSVQGYQIGLWAYEGHETEPIIFSCPDEIPNPAYSAEYLTSNQGGVDWNCDGDVVDNSALGRLALNVNNFVSDPTPPDEYLDGHDEWDTLYFRFSDDTDNYASGTHSTMIHNELNFEQVTLNRISMLLTLYRQIEMFEENDFSATVSLPTGSDVPGCESTDDCFIPSTITIEVGTEVIWSNDDTAAHTITSGSPSAGFDKEFDSGLIMQGINFSHTFDAIGSYPYFCLVHPWMVGIVEVTSISANDEPKKDSFKAAVRDAIDSINIHDISKTKNIVQSIDAELQSSLHAKHYDLIQPITENLDGTYLKALGFGFVPTDAELYPPIISEAKIESMIEKVNQHVATVKLGIVECGDPYILDHNQCVCPAGFEQDLEGDCEKECPADYLMDDEGNCDYFGPKELCEPPLVYYPRTQTCDFPEFGIFTDQFWYSDGESIVLTGKLSEILFGDAIVITITAPNGNIVSIDQVMVDSEKQFSSKFTAGGSLMKQAGEYTIKASYGNNVYKTSFNFSGSDMGPFILVSTTDFKIGYEIIGGKVISVSPDLDANSLIIAIDATDDGKLTITLQRELIDAKIGDNDDDFFVLVDEEEVDFKETSTSTDRTLVILFQEGSKEIEIIGTFVVPEFGVIAALMLAVAITSIVILTTKSRFIPKL